MPTTNPILCLDTFPVSQWESTKTYFKVWIKDGFLNGGIFDSYFYTKPFGSIRIPQALLATLKTMGVPFFYNVFKLPPDCDTVVVFRDPRCLRWALEQKQRGKIKNIVAGPFISTLPYEHGNLLLDPAIDHLIFLSDWHRNLFLREAQGCVPASSTWFAGVDTEVWKPRGAAKNQILIFRKQADSEFYNHVVKTLGRFGQEVKTVTYGKYQTAQYQAELDKSLFSVMLHRSETQGLATFEAWSCNVPTLHCDPGKMTYMSHTYTETSSCPYLRPNLGLRFQGQADFADAVQKMWESLSSFTPRKVVLENFTLEHSARRFLKVLGRVTDSEVPTNQNDNSHLRFQPTVF